MIAQTPAVEVPAFPVEEQSTPSVAPLVQLKAGRGPGIFLAHGIGGNATDFSELVGYIRLPHSIYAMQASGNDAALGKPLRSIEEMASMYLDAIKRVQPEGPYLLVGYSLGGLVSLEVARRLCRAGDRVPLLTLVDSYPHESRLSIRQRCHLFRKLIKRRASHLMRGFSTHEQNCRPSQARRVASTSVKSSRAFERARRDSYVALKRYRPRFYGGSIRFIRAEAPTKFPENPTAVWAHLAAKFESETMPGDHVTMLSTHSEMLASLLTRHIANALPENS